MSEQDSRQNGAEEAAPKTATSGALTGEDPELQSSTRDLKGIAGKIVFAIAVAMSLFHLYTAGFGVLLAHKQRAVHLMFVLVIGFLLYPASKKKTGSASVPWYDWILAASAIAVNTYILVFYDVLVRRGGLPSQTDMIMGVITVLLVLEITRRSIGLALSIIAVVALFYGYFGYLIPGQLGHVGYSVRRLVNQMYMSTEGIFGIPLGVSATFVFLFVLFGAFLEVTGVGQFFIDMAFSVAGRRRGGPAKAAVVASGFMGSISGSSIANTVTTGSFTIPLMKRIGYKANFAGAVEAAASTGGQILPPVMGAAAFIMAEFTGISYVRIIGAAAIPALIYYMGVFVMVHLEAVKHGLEGLPREEIPNFKRVMIDGFHLLVPLVGIIYLLVAGFTPFRAAFIGIVLAVGTCLLRKHTRIRARDLLTALDSGARKAISVAAACACAGIIVGIVTLTGLGLAFANAIVTMAGGLLLPTLFFTMLASILLGMGLPTTAKYIILATMAAPALTHLGVNLLAAHLFILYFGVIADVTPPVALAAYAGAGIAGGNSFRTGLTALRLALAGFIIPYVFALNPTLLFIDTTPVNLLVAVVTACIGVIGLGGAVQGYLLVHARPHERLLLLASALTLLMPGIISDFGGIVAFGLVILLQWGRSRHEHTTPAGAS
ncbi:MAG: TRAP transporter permease [Spirochaetaceae bacterium]